MNKQLLLLTILLALVTGCSTNETAKPKQPPVPQTIFDSSTPAIGSSLPKINVFDLNGKSFDVASVKGPAVIAFGCLT